MNFNEYAEKAIVRYGLTGYNNLARELGMTKSSISMLRSGKNVPSEETMIKLAELAGLPKEEALIDLNLWRSKNDPKRHEIWLRISKLIGCVLTCFFAPFNAFASSFGSLTPSAILQYIASLLLLAILGYIMRQIFIMLLCPLSFFGFLGKSSARAFCCLRAW